MISSVGKNMELGKGNKLIWKIPADMKYFKDITMGHTVVMGYKTYLSLPGDLKGRHMVVITSKKNIDNVEIINDINKAIKKYSNLTDEIFIIGGASLYSQFIEYASKLYLTEIDAYDRNADSFFPEFDKNYWNKEVIERNIYDHIKYEMCVYTRKKIKKM